MSEEKVSMKEVESEIESLKIDDLESMKQESFLDEELTKKWVKLESSDKVVLMVEARVASVSEMLEGAIVDCEGSEDVPIPLPNVNAKVLEKILEYCRKHADTDVQDEHLEEFDEKYLDLSMSVLHSLLMAADYLCIRPLLKKIIMKLASLMRGKSVKQLQKIFGSDNDIPPAKKDDKAKTKAVVDTRFIQVRPAKASGSGDI